MSVAQQIVLRPGNVSPNPTAGTIQFIGTATLLIKVGGFTILTDPNFIHMHEKVYIGNGMTATRLTNPAIEITDLPPLDLIVLSHWHGDHFDQVAERGLDKRLPIVTTPQAAEELHERGFTNLLPLETWQDVSFSKGNSHLRITSLPGRHGPTVVNFMLPDVMGSLLEIYPEPGDSNPNMYSRKIYITGDTILIDELGEIAQHYPDIDLALLHLGGTRVLGILVTMDAEQGVSLLQTLAPKHAIPIHYDDYDLFKSPLVDFQRAVEQAGLAARVHYLYRGDTYNLDE